MSHIALWWCRRQWWLGGRGPADPAAPLGRREFVDALKGDKT